MQQNLINGQPSDFLVGNANDLEYASRTPVLKIFSDVVVELRFATTTVYLRVDPETTPINWRSDEIKSPGRLQAACPGKIKAINLEYPQNP